MKVILCLALLTLVYTFSPHDNYYFDLLDSDPVPSARYSTVLATDGTNLMVFGGHSQNNSTLFDGWKFSMIDKSWSTVSNITILPSCSIQTPNMLVWIIGTTENGSKIIPKLITYNVKRDLFSQQTDPPPNIPTMGVTCAAYNETIFFVFGGKFPNGTNSDKLFSFNVTLHQWSEIYSENHPPPRYGATIISDGSGGLIMYGGFNDSTIYNDMWYFNIETSKWNQSSVKGMSISGRYMHTAVLENQTMIIFGGNNGKTELNDVWLYSFEQKNWCLANPSTYPDPRMGHSSIFHQGRMIIFGGKADNTMMNDMWQFVPEKNCYILVCSDCKKSQGCGWCSKAESTCVSGSDLGPYISDTCSDKDYYSKTTCAPPLELSVWWFLSGGIAIGLLFGVGFFTENNYCREDEYVEIK